MSVEAILRFYNSQVVGKPRSVEAIFNGIKQLGYGIQHPRMITPIGQTVARQKHWEVNQDILAMVYEQGQIEFDCVHRENEFEISIFMAWEPSDNIRPEDTFLGIVSYQTSLFRFEYSKSSYYSHEFINLGKSLFHVVKPEFGWLDFGDFAGFTSEEEVIALKVPHLYWANFFGPLYVQKLGRERLLSTPAWLVEALYNNDGVLVVLSPILGDIHEISETTKSFIQELCE